MQSLYILLWKTTKWLWTVRNWHSKRRNNQQQVQSISYLKLQKDMVNILLVSTTNPPQTHQGVFWAIFWQKRTKHWFSGPDLNIWRAGNISNLISILEICHSFHPIHHWQTTKCFRRRKINSNCDHKSSFFDYFILLIISNDFWIYRSPALKSRSWLGATITF